MRVQVLSRRLLGRVDVMVGLKRGIIVPTNFKVERTIEQVVSILSQVSDTNHQGPYTLYREKRII